MFIEVTLTTQIEFTDCDGKEVVIPSQTLILVDEEHFIGYANGYYFEVEAKDYCKPPSRLRLVV